LELLRFHDKLNLRLSELLIEEGVGGSSGLVCGGGDFGFVTLGALGPIGFCSGLESTLRSKEIVWLLSPKVLDLVIRFSNISPPFGADEERKGETAGLRDGVLFERSRMDSEELVVSSALGLSKRVWCTELLLRGIGMAATSSKRLLEKKLLLEAVIGVVGVLACFRVGGGVDFPISELCSCNAAILAAVGVLKGPRFNGGRLRGCRFLFEGFAASLCSTSDEVPAIDLRGADFREFEVA